MTHHKNQNLAAFLSLDQSFLQVVLSKIGCFNCLRLKSTFIWWALSITVQVFTNQFSASGYLKHSNTSFIRGTRFFWK